MKWIFSQSISPSCRSVMINLPVLNTSSTKNLIISWNSHINKFEITIVVMFPEFIRDNIHCEAKITINFF